MLAKAATRAGVIVFALFLSTAGAAKADKMDTVRIMLNPQVLSNLPILVAIDRGYFAKQNINLEVRKFFGASATMTAMLARNELDIAPQGPSPAFFNQYDAGFNVKIIGSNTGTRKNFADVGWMIVRQDLWDSGAIRNLPDLRGKNVDMANVGTPASLMVLSAIDKAKLTPADMKLSARLKDTTDWYAALKNKAVDVLGAIEPVASELERDKLGHRWVSLSDVAPWYQAGFLVATGPFVQDHRDVVVRFLIAYLQGARDVEKANGKWTPELLKELATWSGLPEAALAGLRGPVDPGRSGAIDLGSMRRVQDYWVTQGLIKRARPVEDMVDDSMLVEARKKFPR